MGSLCNIFLPNCYPVIKLLSIWQCWFWKKYSHNPFQLACVSIFLGTVPSFLHLRCAHFLIRSSGNGFSQTVTICMHSGLDSSWWYAPQSCNLPMNQVKEEEEEKEDDDECLYTRATWMGFYPWPHCRAGFWLMHLKLFRWPPYDGYTAIYIVHCIYQFIQI